MSKLKGTNIASPIVPYTDSDTYPSHLAKYGKGGYRTVQNYNELENISAPRLEEGMLVYLIDEYNGHHFYQYRNGEWVVSDIENDNTLLFDNPEDKEYVTEVIGDSIKIRNELGDKISEGVPEPNQFNFIKINSFYLGKFNSDSSKHDFLPCSHKFIELANVSDKDISLKGLYLMVYTSNKWKKLELTGTIPSGSTYLIRGEQCSVLNSETTYIKVNEFNQEWVEGMVRDRDPYTIYLCWCNEEGKILTESGEFVEYPSQRKDIYFKNNPSFIDCVSLGRDNTYSDKKSIEDPNSYSTEDKIYIRRYPMDPEYVDTLDNRVDWRWHYITSAQYRPAATYENKNINWGTNWMRHDKPLTLTCTVGEYSLVGTITPDKESHPASRCFTWVSSKIDQEYLFIRKHGSFDEWEYFAAFSGDNPDDMLSNIANLSHSKGQWKTILDVKEESKLSDQAGFKYYNKCQWETITGEILVTNRVILYCEEEGEYEYCCGKIKDGAPDPDYVSDIQYMSVMHVDSGNQDILVIGNQFVSNQEDGEGWFTTSNKLYSKIGSEPFAFILCTGNMVKHGNRPGEWVEYINNNVLGKHFAEFITPGTNDMGSIRLYDLDSPKTSPVMFNLFYTFELPSNPMLQLRRLGSYLDTSVTVNEKDIILPGFYFTYFGDRLICSINSAISSSKYRESTANEVYKLIDENYLDPEKVPWSTTKVDERRPDEDIELSSSLYVAIVNWLINVYSYFLTGKSKIARDLDDAGEIYSWLIDNGVLGADYKEDKLLKARRFIVLTNYPPVEPKSLEAKYDRMGSEYINDNLNTRLSFSLSRLFKCLNLHHIFGSSSYASTLISRPIFDAQGRYSESKFTVMDASGGPTGVNKLLIDAHSNQMTSVDTFTPVVCCYDLTTAANLAKGEEYNRFINDSSEEIVLSPTRTVSAKSELDLGDNGYTTLYYIDPNKKADELGLEGIRATVFPNYYLLGTSFTKFTIGDKNFDTIDKHILGRGLGFLPTYGFGGWFNSFETLLDNCKPTAMIARFFDKDNKESIEISLITCDLGSELEDYQLDNYWNTEVRNQLKNFTVSGTIPISAV